MIRLAEHSDLTDIAGFSDTTAQYKKIQLIDLLFEVKKTTGPPSY